MLRWFSWRRGPNYEQELPRLTEKIKVARTRAITASRQQRRWPFLFLVMAVALYLTYVASSIRMSLHHHPRHIAALALSPFLIYIVHKAIYTGATWWKTRADQHLDELTSRRKTLVEEYKKKTHFYEIQKLIDEESTENGKFDRATDGKRSLISKSDAEKKYGLHAIAEGATRSGDKSLSGSQRTALLHPSYAQIHAAGDRGVTQEPVPIYHTSWVDRILDLLVGENEQSPANRYALICSNCGAHNGLAPFGKAAEEVKYRCPVCGHFNGPNSEESETPVGSAPQTPKIGDVKSQESDDSDQVFDENMRTESEKRQSPHEDVDKTSDSAP